MPTGRWEKEKEGHSSILDTMADAGFTRSACMLTFHAHSHWLITC